MDFWRKPWIVVATTLAAILISYAVIDRPVSYLAHSATYGHPLFIWMQRLPELFVPLAFIAFICCGIRLLLKCALNRAMTAAFLASISLFAAGAIKDWLKYAFGRTWPETWTNNNPSLIKDGAFGFNLFHGGQGWASFPSGHTAVICAAVVVLWQFYPRLWPLWSAFIAVVVIGLLGANYHFVSDIIAGGAIGCFTAGAVVAFGRNIAPPPAQRALPSRRRRKKK